MKTLCIVLFATVAATGKSAIRKRSRNTEYIKSGNNKAGILPPLLHLDEIVTSDQRGEEKRRRRAQRIDGAASTAASVENTEDVIKIDFQTVRDFFYKLFGWNDGDDETGSDTESNTTVNDYDTVSASPSSAAGLGSGSPSSISGSELDFPNVFHVDTDSDIPSTAPSTAPTMNTATIDETGPDTEYNTTVYDYDNESNYPSSVLDLGSNYPSSTLGLGSNYLNNFKVDTESNIPSTAPSTVPTIYASSVLDFGSDYPSIFRGDTTAPTTNAIDYPSSVLDLGSDYPSSVPTEVDIVESDFSSSSPPILEEVVHSTQNKNNGGAMQQAHEIGSSYLTSDGAVETSVSENDSDFFMQIIPPQH